MFETTLNPAAFDEAAKGESLRVPAWEELAARLAAARDLREALGRVSAVRKGSFAGFSAGEGQQVNGEADSINPNGLAHSKTDRGMIGAAADGAVSADRETR